MVSKSTISTEFVGLEMVSPIILLSGCVGFGDEYSRLEGFSNKVVGGIVLKGTTLEPRLGNTPHRVTETPSGMLNSIGLQNPGVSRVVNDILPGLQPLETQYIANVSGSTVDEYVAVCKAFDRSLVAAIELNISCPNVKKGGMEFGNDPEMSAQVVEACRKTTTKPIITKLSPNQSDIQLNARLCIEAGTDALAVINTITGMMIDIEKRTPVLGNHAGGLSGPAIKPIALKKVYDVYQVSKNHNIPILGQGGVSSAEDAIEFLLAGSSAVGVGTALFFDPLVCNKINKGLEEYLEKNNFNGIDQLIGAAA